MYSFARATKVSVMVCVGTFVALGSCSGSGCLTPYPSGQHYAGPKSDNGINVRFSDAGVQMLNTQWQTLIEAFAPGGTIDVPINCFTQSITTLGEVAIGDQGSPGCTSESCGQLDGQCNKAGRPDSPANAHITVTGFSLVPKAPDSLDAVVTVSIATDDILVATRDHSLVLCGLLSGMKCSIDFKTSRNGPLDNPISAQIKFSIDNRFDKLLSFSVVGFDGTEVCGASGASPKPRCLDSEDLNLDGRNTCGSTYCGTFDWNPIKKLILRQVSDPLQKALRDALAGQSCRSCETNADCPVSTDGSNTQSVCDPNSKRCMVGTACVPRVLGLEGKMSLASLLGNFGVPAEAEMELSIAAGATVAIDDGMSFGTRTGVQPAAVSTCVPPMPAPVMPAVTFPAFDAEATPGSGYHVGLGVSADFLNTLFWSAEQSGSLCLAISSDNVSLLSTGLFKTFLQSLGKLATVDGKDAPMMVVFRPARPPTVDVGDGAIDPMTNKPKPLLTLKVPDLSFDFYALLGERQVRLFTLTADIAIPLALTFDGCDKVTPVLGDVKSLITNIRASNSEILAEDPQVLAGLIPSIVGLAEPALAKGLSGFNLPSLGSFKLKIVEAKGLGRISGGSTFEHLGLYAQLLPLNAMCAVSAPNLTVSLVGKTMPQESEMRLVAGKALPLPQALVQVEAKGLSGVPEYAYKIDDGLWTQFAAAPSGQLVVSHPRFLIQGGHTIHVRARLSDDPQGFSAVQSIPFVVDWSAPEVSLQIDRAADRLLVKARDVVGGQALEFAYQVGTGPVSPFGAAREIALVAVEQQGGVTVFARDASGNVGQATYSPSSVDTVGPIPPAVRDEGAALATSGCSSVGALNLVALCALWLSRRRRS